MGLLTEKYIAWAKHPQKYTAAQVLNQIVADLKWLDEEQAKNWSIPAVVGRSESCLAKCDVCGCQPSVIIRTEFGTFCQAHARYVR